MRDTAALLVALCLALVGVGCSDESSQGGDTGPSDGDGDADADQDEDDGDVTLPCLEPASSPFTSRAVMDGSHPCVIVWLPIVMPFSCIWRIWAHARKSFRPIKCVVTNIVAGKP